MRGVHQRPHLNKKAIGHFEEARGRGPSEHCQHRFCRRLKENLSNRDGLKAHAVTRDFSQYSHFESERDSSMSGIDAPQQQPPGNEHGSVLSKLSVYESNYSKARNQRHQDSDIGREANDCSKNPKINPVPAIQRRGQRRAN